MPGFFSFVVRLLVRPLVLKRNLLATLDCSLSLPRRMKMIGNVCYHNAVLIDYYLCISHSVLKYCTDLECPYLSVRNATRNEDFNFRLSIRKW